MLAPDLPQNFTQDFFFTIRQMHSQFGDMETITMKQIYTYLMKNILNVQPLLVGEQEEQELETPLLPLKCEISSTNTDWTQTWKSARITGLGPYLTTLHKVLWGIIPTRERLHKIMPNLYSGPYFKLCETV